MADERQLLDPTHADYWVVDAEKLKKAAELCWSAKDNIRQNSDNARMFGLDKSLIDAADDAESELTWLYPNLIVFAIQHMAIGILISRNPRQIMEQGQRFPIIKAIESCGVKISPEIINILSDVENSFKWNEKIPRWTVRLSAEHIHALKRHKTPVDAITFKQKKALDALYSELYAMALKDTDLAQAMDMSEESSDAAVRGEPFSV